MRVYTAMRRVRHDSRANEVDMSVFQHPHLTRGIVKTAKGAFVITRGLVEMPDDIGEALGWQRVDAEDNTPARTPVARPEQRIQS